MFRPYVQHRLPAWPFGHAGYYGGCQAFNNIKVNYIYSYTHLYVYLNSFYTASSILHHEVLQSLEEYISAHLAGKHTVFYIGCTHTGSRHHQSQSHTGLMQVLPGERERETESLHLSSHTGLMQVLPGHPLADPKRGNNVHQYKEGQAYESIETSTKSKARKQWFSPKPGQH